ncbi:hypothetical protein AK812_SmicGene36617 [Symbiodinium microadriaticum]|uniref:Reverse transcriptase domain-containing protein n=1 Tax=Symbiodinium microadriaticum TaxID=2951 RepID=A0A1Q9CIJ2_SYMMI|nr:hypothetical protein AK812_SmicGene36617 [Symbiodinium microadriaticum]CAE7906776.1 unnamed protein product [Symbiodinium sp. KB8]
MLNMSMTKQHHDSTSNRPKHPKGAGKRSYQKALRQAEKNGAAFYRGKSLTFKELGGTGSREELLSLSSICCGQLEGRKPKAYDQQEMEVLLAFADLHRQFKQRIVWRTWAALATLARQSAEARTAKQRKCAQRQALIDEQLRQAEAKSAMDGSHSLYKVIKTFKRGRPSERVQLRDEQGRFLTAVEVSQFGFVPGRGTEEAFDMVDRRRLREALELAAAALRQILTMYADDTLLQMHFDDLPQMQEALRLCDLLLDQLTELGFKVNPEKSALLLQLHGGSAQQIRNKLVLTKKGEKYVQVPSGRLIALKTQVPYLGIIVSYHDYEMQSLRHRLQASKAVMKEVAHAVRNSHAVTERSMPREGIPNNVCLFCKLTSSRRYAGNGKNSHPVKLQENVEIPFYAGHYRSFVLSEEQTAVCS